MLRGCGVRLLALRIFAGIRLPPDCPRGAGWAPHRHTPELVAYGRPAGRNQARKLRDHESFCSKKPVAVAFEQMLTVVGSSAVPSPTRPPWALRKGG